MKKRNLFFGIGGILGSMLDVVLTGILIVLTLLLKSCVAGTDGDTTKLDVVATVISLVLIFSIVAAIITAIKALGGRKVPLFYIILQQVVHLAVAILFVFTGIGDNETALYLYVIAVLCVVHFVLYIFGIIKQAKIAKAAKLEIAE